MNTEVFTWSYVCDPDGLCYVVNLPSEKLFTSDDGYWHHNDINDKEWYQVDDDGVPDVSDAESSEHEVIHAASLLDLGSIPRPQKHDGKPIVIVQKITSSNTYFTLD